MHFMTYSTFHKEQVCEIIHSVKTVTYESWLIM